MATTDFQDNSVIEKYEKYLLVNKYFGKPAFIEFICDVKGLKILDLGCGTGHFSRDLTKMGGECIGIDKSNKFIEIAKGIENKEKMGIKYFCLNGANLKGIESKSFDKVFLFQVLLNVPDKNELINIFKESRRVLKTGGEMIFSVFHPMLIQNYKDNLREIMLPRNFNYFEKGITYKARHLMTDSSWMEFINSHWTIEFIMDVIKENTYSIIDIKEPEPKRDEYWEYFKNICNVPHYIFMKIMT